VSGRLCTFDPVKHEYRIDGRLVPGVTSIIKPYYRGAERFTEEGRERGRRVHLAAQFFLENDLDESSVDPTIEGYLEAIRRLDAAVGLRRPTAKIEVPLFSTDLGFAGIPDWHHEGRTPTMALTDTILDWKSSDSIDPVTALQTAGYEFLTGRRCRRIGVSLRANGTFKLVEFTDRSDRAHFLNALALHQRFIASARPVEEATEKIHAIA
jgi:hypothetical protein